MLGSSFHHRRARKESDHRDIVLLRAMVAPVCNYWQRYGGRTEQFPSLPYRLARLKLELNASCNTESMS